MLCPKEHFLPLTFKKQKENAKISKSRSIESEKKENS